jgi:hypothetical protein
VNAEQNCGDGHEPHTARREDPGKEHAEQNDVEQPHALTSDFHDDRKYEYCDQEHDQQGDETGISEPVTLEYSD